MYMTRNEATKRIRKALKEKTGRVWSVTGGRGTGYGWVRIQAAKKDRVAHRQNPGYKGWMTISQCVMETGKPPWIEFVSDDKAENQYTSDADCELLTRIFQTPYKHHYQGLSIKPGATELYVQRVEAWEPGGKEN
jgi:hypothetical protein